MLPASHVVGGIRRSRGPVDLAVAGHGRQGLDPSLLGQPVDGRGHTSSVVRRLFERFRMKARRVMTSMVRLCSRAASQWTVVASSKPARGRETLDELGRLISAQVEGEERRVFQGRSTWARHFYANPDFKNAVLRVYRLLQMDGAGGPQTPEEDEAGFDGYETGFDGCDHVEDGYDGVEGRGEFEDGHDDVEDEGVAR